MGIEERLADGCDKDEHPAYCLNTTIFLRFPGEIEKPFSRQVPGKGLYFAC